MNEVALVTAGRFGKVSVSRLEQLRNILLKFVTDVSVTLDILILLIDLQFWNTEEKLTWFGVKVGSVTDVSDTQLMNTVLAVAFAPIDVGIVIDVIDEQLPKAVVKLVNDVIDVGIVTDSKEKQLLKALFILDTLFIVDGKVTVLNLTHPVKTLARFVTLDHPLGIVASVIDKQPKNKFDESTAPTVGGKFMFVRLKQLLNNEFKAPP
jgi:hypothetical protein